MAIAPSQGKLLYHITHISNIPSILKYGLMPRKELEKQGIVDFYDIADHEILSKRETYKRALSEYLPFHFYSKNPFDGQACKTYGAGNMAMITISRDLHQQYEFYIIPSHPLDKDEPDIYPYDEGFRLIHWDILDRKSGRDYRDPEIKKACMAECVMKYTIPCQAFHCIFVANEEGQQKILQAPNSNLVRITINPNMFPQSI